MKEKEEGNNREGERRGKLQEEKGEEGGMKWKTKEKGRRRKQRVEGREVER